MGLRGAGSGGCLTARLTIVDAERELPQGPTWAIAVIALVAGASSYFVRPVEVRAMVMGAVALVGAGLLTYLWGQEDLNYIWFGSAVLGGCLASLTAPGRRRHLR